MKPATKEAYKLVHQGALALADIEHHGMRIDVPYLDGVIEKVGSRIRHLTERLRGDEVCETWKRVYGRGMKIGSRTQLGRVLFDEMELPCRNRTAPTKRHPDGQPSTSEADLRRLDVPFVKRYLRVEKLKKLLSTYLKGVRREVVDGYVHPSFNLHLARTYRPSCDNPNFTNIPIRDKLMGKLIRRAFIPRPGNVLLEVDYGGHEFKIAACFWKDPAMVEYASDPDKDIHRDVAAECFMLDREQVSGVARYAGKNCFVFPELYGDWYVNCARNMWEAIDERGIETADGTPMKEHLAGKGVADLDDFELHMKSMEERFNGWFPTWAEEKVKWWELYKKRGWFRLLTGFVCQGVYERKKVYNYPVQGPAFHCLLLALIRLNKLLKRRKMKTVIVGQIYDSLQLDVPKGELDDVLGMVVAVMTKEVRKAWEWIIVPLSVDAEVAEKTWYDKKEISL